jgi:hypothetical protein
VLVWEDGRFIDTVEVAEEDCDHDPEVLRSVWCPRCGAQLHPLRVRMTGFLGKESTNPTMELFWDTGDPGVFAGAAPQPD